MAAVVMAQADSLTLSGPMTIPVDGGQVHVPYTKPKTAASTSLGSFLAPIQTLHDD